jgi:hypothetical protein
MVVLYYKYMGYVYLIESYNTQFYKIGISKNDPHKRLKQLATANADELRLITTYESEYYRKLEKWLHRKFSQYRLEGEWFKLPDDDIIGFNEICVEAESIITVLINENPFYN